MLSIKQLPPPPPRRHLHEGVSPELSPRLTRLRFPAACCVVALHTGLLAETECLPPASAVVQFLHILGMAAVPFFFFCSSYLYFAAPRKSYRQLLWSKLWRLVVPLALWTAVPMVLYFCVDDIDFGERGNPHWWGTAPKWLGAFVPGSQNGPLWFLKGLVAFFVLAPVAEWLFLRVPWPLLLAALFAWFTTQGGYVHPTNACLHIYLGFLAARFGADRPLKWLDSRPAGWFYAALLIPWLIFAVVPIDDMANQSLPRNVARVLLFEAAVVAALRWARRPTLDVSAATRALASCSMFIYCSHAVRDFVYWVMERVQGGLPTEGFWPLLAWAVAFLLVLLPLLALGLALRRWAPVVYRPFVGEWRPRWHPK